MTLVFSITVKQGTKVVAEIKGRQIDGSITVNELHEQVIATEQFLERLTGLRYHINVEQISNG